MSIYNPLPELFNIGFDEHTAVAALSSALNIHGHTFVEKNHVYGDTNRGFKAIFNRDQRLSKIQIDQKLWVEAEKIIKLDMQKPVRTKIIPTILFAPLPVNGYYRADDWIQISPIRARLRGSNPFGAVGGEINLLGVPQKQFPRPFILEVKYRPSSLVWVEAVNSHRQLENARLLLSAWIKCPLQKGIESYNWVTVNGEGPQLALGSMTTGIDEYFQDAVEFSDVRGFNPIAPIPIETYVDEVVPNQEGIRLTDIAALKRAFDRLSTADQIKYLRCCSAIHEAEYYSRHTSQAIVSYVSAVEALLDDGEKCLQCGSHIGIGKAFKHFVNHYVRPSEATRPLLEALYVFRSRLAHGAYSLSIDEPFMGNESFKTIMPTVAHWIAKKGAVSWLLEKTK